MSGLQIVIRENATGVVRTYRPEYLPQYDNDEDGTRFQWTDGNYACDCNRALFFMRAGGEQPAWDGGGECGMTRYAVLSITMPNGKVLDDIDDPDPTQGP